MKVIGTGKYMGRPYDTHNRGKMDEAGHNIGRLKN